MPWHVAKTADCPDAKPWAVIKDSDGTVASCNETEEAAMDHMKALYANEPAMHSTDDNQFESRSVAFEVTRSDDEDDGLTLEGYAAVFNRVARINSGWVGEFDEVIAAGAFADAIATRTPVLMFEHGQHPLLGSMPLGVIRSIHEDKKGLFINARLSDNWLVQPVRDAVREGAVSGMSFRFSVNPDGETKQKRKGEPPLRTITRFAEVPELGPVVFPAYEPTTVSVRSLIELLPDLAAREPDARSDGSGDPDTQPGNGEVSPTLRTRDRVLRFTQRTKPSWL